MAKYVNTHIISDAGGFGTVWKCVRTQDGQSFAKKEIKNVYNTEALKRFRQEVQFIKQLWHPNIVRVIATHFRPTKSRSLWYIMPLYKGTLEDWLNDIAKSRKGINEVFMAILDGVGHAHSEGICHRDIKPANILMNSIEDIVVGDFGLGRNLNGDTDRMTRSKSSMGSDMYMAPEQNGAFEKADKRSDIFSIGRVLLALYTGPLTSLVTDTEGLPDDIASIVRRCVESSPKSRFQSVAELRSAWMNAARISAVVPKYVSLIEAMGDPENPAMSPFKQLRIFLMRSLKNGELISQFLMDSKPTVLRSIFQVDRTLARKIVRSFKAYCTSQRWPLSHVDKIGAKCQSIFDTCKDSRIRAYVASCAIEVGVSHSRGYVTDLAIDMLDATTVVSGSVRMRESLANASPNAAVWLIQNGYKDFSPIDN